MPIVLQIQEYILALYHNDWDAYVLRKADFNVLQGLIRNGTQSQLHAEIDKQIVRYQRSWLGGRQHYAGLLKNLKKCNYEAVRTEFFELEKLAVTRAKALLRKIILTLEDYIEVKKNTSLSLQVVKVTKAEDTEISEIAEITEITDKNIEAGSTYVAEFFDGVLKAALLQTVKKISQVVQPSSLIQQKTQLANSLACDLKELLVESDPSVFDSEVLYAHGLMEALVFFLNDALEKNIKFVDQYTFAGAGDLGDLIQDGLIFVRKNYPEVYDKAMQIVNEKTEPRIGFTI